MDFSLNVRKIDKIVFIGGTPRSGTTLVQRMLGQHPAISAGPEFDLLPIITDLYKCAKAKIKHGRITEYVDLGTLKNIFEKFILSMLSQRALREGKRIISEKTPLNVLCFKELNELFPESFFIHIIRDPRDVIVSLKRVKKRFQNSGLKPPARTQNVENSAREWSLCVTAPEKCGITGSPNYKEVFYEKLVRSPEETAKDICGFVRIDFHEKMLSPNENKTTIKNPSYLWSEKGQLDRPIYSERIGQWKSGLSYTELIVVDKLLRGLLIKFGYEDSDSWLKEYINDPVKYYSLKIRHYHVLPVIKAVATRTLKG